MPSCVLLHIGNTCAYFCIARQPLHHPMVCLIWICQGYSNFGIGNETN
jgi:hypothetical protein